MKAMDREGSRFAFLKKFLQISLEKLKAVKFQIRELMKDPMAQMSVKLHFLLSHLDYFPKNCGDLSEEQDEHFHKDFYGKVLPSPVGCKLSC